MPSVALSKERVAFGEEFEDPGLFFVFHVRRHYETVRPSTSPSSQ